MENNSNRQINHQTEQEFITLVEIFEYRKEAVYLYVQYITTNKKTILSSHEKWYSIDFFVKSNFITPRNN
jgi:catalase (peroxidase I)